MCKRGGFIQQQRRPANEYLGQQPGLEWRYLDQLVLLLLAQLHLLTIQGEVNSLRLQI